MYLEVDACFIFSNSKIKDCGNGIILLELLVFGVSIYKVFLLFIFKVHKVLFIDIIPLFLSKSSHVKASSSPSLIPV